MYIISVNWFLVSQFIARTTSISSNRIYCNILNPSCHPYWILNKISVMTFKGKFIRGVFWLIKSFRMIKDIWRGARCLQNGRLKENKKG